MGMYEEIDINDGCLRLIRSHEHWVPKNRNFGNGTTWTCYKCGAIYRIENGKWMLFAEGKQ